MSGTAADALVTFGSASPAGRAGCDMSTWELEAGIAFPFPVALTSSGISSEVSKMLYLPVSSLPLPLDLTGPLCDARK